MAILKLNGDTSGYVILQAASVAQNNVLTLPNTTDTLLTSNGSVMNSASINGSTLNNPILAGSGVITGSLTGGTLANTTLSSPTITGSWSQQNLNLVGTSALVGNGVYIPAVNTVGFITNTTERMRLTAGGNLLINGTTAPSSGNATVVISGIGTNGGGLQLSGGAAGGVSEQSLNGGGVTWNTYTGAVGSETYAERMRLDSNGNLGVGVSTLSLGGRLTVGKPAVTSFTGSASGVVTVSDTSSTLNSYTAIDFTNTNQQLPLARMAMQFTSSGSYLSLGTTNSYGSGVNNTAMTIDPTGSVGIGTSSPITKLTVQTAALTDAIRWTDNITSTGILSTASGLSTMWTTTALGFGTGSGAYTERMRISGSGNLLVGTTTVPSSGSSTLVINGQGTNAGGVEYVNQNNGGGNVQALSAGGLQWGTFTGAVGSEVYSAKLTLGASGILSTYYTSSTSLTTFNVAQNVIGGLHFATQQGTSTSAKAEAAITFGYNLSLTNAQAGIYVTNDNSSGTAMAFATTESYATGPQIGLSITNTGGVNVPRTWLTVPNQPAWHAYYTGTADLAITIGTTTFTYNIASVNNGSNYSTSSGRFTAPVAGTYYVYAQVQYAAIVAPSFTGLYITKNGTLYVDGYTQNTGYSEPVVHATITLAAGDYLQVVANYSVSASASVIQLSAGTRNYFGGYLIG